MRELSYQGWANYETWIVALWLDNERESYQYWREQARRHREQAPACDRVKRELWTVAEAARLNLASQLRAEIEDSKPLTTPTMYADLLQAALGEVDWHEIAVNLIEENEP